MRVAVDATAALEFVIVAEFARAWRRPTAAGPLKADMAAR
jgi:hypothetical protein